MALQSPGVLNQNNHAPFDYEVILNGQGLGSYSTLIDLQSVTLGYEIGESRAYMNMWNRNSVQFGQSAVPSSQIMPVPHDGDDVIITVKQSQFDVPRIIFRGKIDEVTDRLTPEGKRYSVSVVSKGKLLNERRVTFAANTWNDPINPQPKFDPVTGGASMEARLKTVYEIVQAIMDFRDAWMTDEEYSFSDIDWNGLDNHSSCGLYVITNVNFADTPKGDAINELLQRAGNFRLHYDPDTDAFSVVELNLATNRCGPKWNIAYPSINSDSGAAVNYAGALALISDQTAWSSRSSANTVRVTSGKIRFYSGNFIIPEMIENLTQPNPTPGGPPVAVSEGQRLRQVENDTVDQQKERAVNQDGAFYRMHPPYNLWKDPRQYQQYVVGLPLFPDWNVFDDFLPDIAQIMGITPSSNIPAGHTESEYLSQAVEFRPVTLGTQIMHGAVRLGHPNNLRVYQAWFIDGPCPACEGSGNVQQVYSGPGNVPILGWETVYGGKTKRLKVTNYIFDPLKFGVAGSYTGGLAPFDGSSEYAVPWKNLCPVCRGVGQNPVYKIRNIDRHLVSGRSFQKNMGTNTGAEDTPIDTEFTQVAPETWDQTQSRLTIQMSPTIVYEEPILGPHRLPKHAYRNNSWDQLKTLSNSDRVKIFDHPLKGFTKLLASTLGITGTESKLVPDDDVWNKCKTVFTSINFRDSGASIDYAMGRVTFHNPIDIPCEARYSTLREVRSKDAVRFSIKKNGLIDDAMPLDGMRTVDHRSGRPVGHWRPARAWMQFFYVKDNYYAHLDHVPATIQYTDADGNINTYYAKAMIVDGCWSCEVYKAQPDDWGANPPEFGNQDRIVLTAITDSQAIVETTESDLDKLAVPPTADITPEDLEAVKRQTYGCDFPTARHFRWEQPTPGENLYELEGISPSMPQQAEFRPRFYKWRLRDDRPKLLAMAIRRLETDNDLKVTGSLVVKGMTANLATGLGYIEYPNKGRAAVIKVTHNFADGYTTSLEVTRAAARSGEMPPDDKITLQGLRKEFNQFVMSQRKATWQGPQTSASDASQAAGDGITGVGPQ